MQRTAPDDVGSFARNLAYRLAAAGSGTLVGVYLHGSAVLDDSQAETSDVDILVVVQDRIPKDSIKVMAQILAEPVVSPGSGVEVSVVEESACRRPSPPWPYKVHVTTSKVGARTVWCKPGSGDSDLSLHYAVTRQVGWAAYGPLRTDVVGEVGRDLLAAQLAAELLWAVDHASESYAVLNTCRALRWATEGTFCSKTAGARWALTREVEPALVEKALTARRTHRKTAVGHKAGAFARQVASLLGTGRANWPWDPEPTCP
ncbi:MAG: aminoglycoside adenylyltransferase domain-containing protein [Candidatus Dormibacteria bacterium]